MQLYNVNFGKFYEKVSVRYPITTNTLNGRCYGTSNINILKKEYHV